MTPQKASILLRAWHKAFKDFGKSNETKVKELLEAADLIDSLAADLDTLRKFTVELSARNEELHKEKLTLALRVKQLEVERDAAIDDMTEMAQYVSDDVCPWCDQTECELGCMGTGANSGFNWRGVQKEE